MKSTLLLALILLAPPAGMALEGPTMSRLEAHVTPGSAVVNLDQAVVESLCRDEDGCDLILSLESTTQDWVLMQRVRLSLSRLEGTLGTHRIWSTGPIRGNDHNPTKESVASVSRGGINSASCSFNDGDGPTDDADTALGFSLQLTGADAVCDAVLID